MERGIIDRFENDIVVIEVGGSTRDFPKASLPRNAKVGDSVIIDNGEIRIDRIETANRKKEINSLMDELFE
ncbi:DUF3006 domain-containing protein [Cohnella cholangitidis]|uniref:DUF3006 domain-containing protein n=1 Tax=Cohnella cholangitidis TaxID=2598458 RepID=A0A7G5BTQ9_9BACL|nr:DUF3006 domain-containing protein [Cohnella cholangitidis]QMV40343.1 DUF3006 domain-containing protein [Cohnella cholangitidis]